ncbi:MAG TPA: ATP:cob(I)alamin adenosyltransferase [Alphaproteobacteria bacterium]|nr:ATP:cob(I)alamin adenosyltransferase [Alphaproteobacteria bacterium]
MAQVTTKSGDTGMTQLNPNRIASKTHPVIEIQGAIDELSCALGLSGDKFDGIQTFLSELMGYFYYKAIDDHRIAQQIWQLENYILTHNNSIPPFFVNPRGYISLARSICRRAERRVVELMESERKLPEIERYGMNLAPVIQYLNRLSDYLFVKSFERAAAQPTLFKDDLTEVEPKAAVA